MRPKAGVIHLEFRACQVVAVCPSCGSRSTRVHSRYWRTLADLPWQGIPVQISLRARKYFCADERCMRRIFTEPLPGTVSRYGRRSYRASDALSWVTLALSGRAAREQNHTSSRTSQTSAFICTGTAKSARHRRGRRAIDMERCCATWSAAASSIYSQPATQRPSQHGCINIQACRW